MSMASTNSTSAAPKPQQEREYVVINGRVFEKRGYDNSLIDANGDAYVLVDATMCTTDNPTGQILQRKKEDTLKPVPDHGVIDSFAGGVVDNATFGHAAEAGAMTNALLYGGGYSLIDDDNSVIARYRRVLPAFEAKKADDQFVHPGAWTSGEVTTMAAGATKAAGEIVFSKLILKKAERKAAEQAASEVLTTGEPVSVATGEYLETWRDFLVPGSISFDGSRYMGLKLPTSWRWRNPLGACQISAFDEHLASRKEGDLDFLQADGKRIRFQRPFNFLPSTNAAFPHLELKAPEPGSLCLKDRTIVKYFSEYDDHFHRLEKIEDLNGNSLLFQRSSAGVLQKIVGSNGLSLEFDNDADGRRTVITLVGTDKSRLVLANYAYDHRGRMVSAKCAFGMSVRYEWHASRPLLLCWHNLTRRSETTFTYDDEGRVIHTATSGIWNEDRFRYDRDRRETTYLPTGEEERAQRFAYDEHENITAEIDALGGTISHRYDQAAFRIATTDANGNTSHTRYDVYGNVRHFTDAEGRKTVYGWGRHGDIDKIIDGSGCVRKFENDNKGNVLAAIDAEGNETRFERDERGRIARTIFADGSEERRAYDQHGRLWGIKDAKGGVTELLYDAFGRLIERKDADGGVTRLVYEAGAGGFATPTSLTRPDGVTISRRFDAEGSLASVTDGEGRVWTYEFGAFEVLQAIVDPKGGRLAFSYDSEGRPTAVGNAVGQIYRLVRDVAGRVVLEEDFDGRRTRYTRDPGGRVIETVKPDGARLVHSYDRTDKVTRIESFAPGGGPGAKPQDITRFWYDGRGLLEKAENGSSLIEYRRDRNGAVIAEALNGRWVESRLDAMGRRIERRIPGSSPGTSSLVAYAHDPLGLIEDIAIGDHAPLSFTRDAMGRETRRANGIGFKLDSAYDIAGQLIKQTGGFDIASFGTGLAGAMAVRQAGFAPGAGSQIERSYSWDKASSPLSIADSLWGKTSYAYDANGQVSEARFGDQLVETFAYDAARNMAGASSSGPQAISGLGEDIGKFVAWKSSPGGVVQTARGPRGERLTLTHDKCGRVIERRVERDGFRTKVWRYEWDAHDRLVRCVTPDREAWRYGYDPFGRRVWKVKEFSEVEARGYVHRFPGLIDPKRLPDRGATLAEAQRSRLDSGNHNSPDKSPIVGAHFLWDGDVLAEEAPLRLDGSVDWHKATRWHYEPGSFRPLAKETPEGDLLYIVNDHLGTPREMVDEKGDVRWAASYTTWGLIRGIREAVPQAANDDEVDIGWSPRGSGGGGSCATFGNLALKPVAEDSLQAYACPIRFQGQWQDEETGLYYNRHRHYDPLAGQYISSDPVGLEGGDRPQGYVGAPTVWIDPFSLSSTVSSTNKRGPKTSDLEGQNPAIIAERKRLEAEGHTIVGGGRVPGLKERVIIIENGYKGTRRPDISYKPKDGGPERGVNVGKTDSNGNPILREQKALDDLNNSGYPTEFVPYR